VCYVFVRPFVKRFALCYRFVVYLSCLSCLSVTLVYCGQTVRRMKTKLGVQVDLGPGHTVLDGDPPPPPLKGHSPPFSAHICYGQMASWIKMPLVRSPGEFVLVRWGPCYPSPKRGRSPPPKKKVGPCLLCENSLIDQDGTWREGRPQPRGLCVPWGPSLPPKKGAQPHPNFRPMCIAAKRQHGSRCHLVQR